MSHQELQVLFDGAGAEDLADRLIDFVESELDGEATASPYDPAIGEWPGDDLGVAPEADEEDTDDTESDSEEAPAADDDESEDDTEVLEADGDDAAVSAGDSDDFADGGGILVTLSPSCFEISSDVDSNDVELRAAALLEWLDEETKHVPHVRVDLWVGADADGAQALEEMDVEILLEMLSS